MKAAKWYVVSGHFCVAFLVGFASILASPVRGSAGVIEPTNGLIGYWTGNQTAADSSPVGNNGSFGGSYVPNAPGGGWAFDLSTSKVTIANNAAYSFQQYPGWTVAFWFNTNGIAPNSINDLFLGQDNGSGYQPKWFIDYGYTVYGPNSNFIWHVNDYNTERIFLASQSVNPIPNGWNQLTVVIDNVGQSIAFYLNGKPIGTSGLPGYVLETSAPLIFGYAEGFYFDGWMSDVAIYNRALSSQEVTELVDTTSATPLTPNQVATTSSGLVFSRVTQTFNGTITLKNIGGSTISGPLQVVFTGLTPGVTLANATGILGGTPYLTVPAIISLAPGQSVNVNIQFKNASSTAITFTPEIYSGSL